MVGRGDFWPCGVGDSQWRAGMRRSRREISRVACGQVDTSAKLVSSTIYAPPCGSTTGLCSRHNSHRQHLPGRPSYNCLLLTSSAAVLAAPSFTPMTFSSSSPSWSSPGLANQLQGIQTITNLVQHGSGA